MLDADRTSLVAETLEGMQADEEGSRIDDEQARHRRRARKRAEREERDRTPLLSTPTHERPVERDGPSDMSREREWKREERERDRERDRHEGASSPDIAQIIAATPKPHNTTKRHSHESSGGKSSRSKSRSKSRSRPSSGHKRSGDVSIPVPPLGFHQPLAPDE